MHTEKPVRKHTGKPVRKHSSTWPPSLRWSAACPVGGLPVGGLPVRDLVVRDLVVRGLVVGGLVVGGRVQTSRPTGRRSSGISDSVRSMSGNNDPAQSTTATNEPAAASPDEPGEAQFGPHRFYAGEGGGGEQYRGARFDVLDMRGARFTDCDLTGVTIRDGCLVNVSISGYLSNVTVNDVDVSDFVSAELDRLHPERVQFRAVRTADDVRAMWDTIEQLWTHAVERAGRLPAGALAEHVNEEWSFEQTLRHLVFITDAWASRTVLDQPMPYHPLGLPQSWYPDVDAAALGIDLTAQPGYAEILAARADRMAVMRDIVAGLTDDSLGRLCARSPAPGYPDEDRPVFDCIGVVVDEEIEHYRFAVRDLAVLEAGSGARPA
jgi:DinB superfamily